jgi:hypothetical protein
MRGMVLVPDIATKDTTLPVRAAYEDEAKTCVKAGEV